MNKLTCAIGLCIILGKSVQAQSLPAGIPIITGATIDAKVNFDTGTQTFTYNYTVINSSANVGKIIDFEIDITTTPGGVLVGAENLVNSAARYTKTSSALTLSRIGPSLIPIGFVAGPVGWLSGLSENGTAGWFGPVPPGADLLPGQSLSGFVFASHGMPGIRQFTLDPHYDPNDFFPGIDDTGFTQAQQEEFTREDLAVRNTIKFHGLTVGPVNPPSLTEPGQLIDSLATSKHQSVSLGWIFGPGVNGIVTSLDAKLTAAKNSIASGDKTAAKNQLKAFINELDAQRGKHMNDNAYFLLKTNAQFIVSKI